MLLVLAASALLAWLALRTDQPAPAPGGATAVTDTVPGGDAEPAPRPRARSRAEGTPPPLSQAAAEDAAAPATRDRPVEVVDEVDASGELSVEGPDGPLAGVRVAFLAADAVPNAAPAPADTDVAEDPVRDVLARGRQFETDAAGRVRLPRFAKRAQVAAVRGNLQGVASIEPDGAPWTLALRRVLALDVVVRRADGEPCGGVRALLLTEWGHGADTAAHALTDGVTGTAHLAYAGSVDLDDGESMALRLALPLAPPPRVEIDPEAPPSAPVVFTLPATGSVRCEVVSDEGAPATDALVVSLRNAEASDPASRNARHRGDARVTTAVVASGAATFPFVGLGLELEAEVFTPNRSRATVRTRFRGPQTAGEETVVRVRLGGARPAVVGRLVDGSGAPLPGIELVAYLVEPGTEEWGSEREGAVSTTGADGRFRFTVDRPMDAAAPTKVRLVSRGRAGAGSQARRSIRMLELPERLAAAETDLGDVTFHGTGVAAGGVVVDAAGQPVAGVQVRLMWGREGRRACLYEFRATTTDAQGRFRIEAEPEATLCSVGVVREGWYVEDPPEFEPGATDLRVVLVPAGGIAGSLRLPDGLTASDFRILVRGGPERNGGIESASERGATFRTKEDGSFELPSLRPGRADVLIQCGWRDADVIHVVEGVDVVAGRVTRDPRLQAIDLSKLLRMVRVTAVDPERRPVAGAAVHFREGGDDTSWKEAETGADGVASLPSIPRDGRTLPLEVVVRRRGYRSAALAGVETDRTAVLRPGKPVVVRVRLADGSPLPDPPFHLAPKLNFVAAGGAGDDDRDDDDDEDDDFGNMDPRSVDPDLRFGKDRVVLLETACPGRYRVTLMLWESDVATASGTGIATSPKPVFVEVPEDATGPVEVSIGVDAEALAEATKR